jgi:hypothetical protein
MTDGNFLSPRAGHGNYQNLRSSKTTDMTIHWKALEELLSDDPISFLIQPFLGDAFSEFF